MVASDSPRPSVIRTALDELICLERLFQCLLHGNPSARGESPVLAESGGSSIHKAAIQSRNPRTNSVRSGGLTSYSLINAQPHPLFPLTSASTQISRAH